ncbi:MAG: hypothetical protein DHS20C11_03680 [Lysobacteraceae bacterium]|nr:MAG: hypothetical protein DHS20C11_03680 [Xanthomonadaceae bacterium]
MNLSNSTKSILMLTTAALMSNAGAQSLEADYPLLTDLADATGNHGDMILQGNPGPPAPPSTGMPLCTNGIYISLIDGQDIQTPILNNFTLDSFIFIVDFNITELPDANDSPPRQPVIMGGWLSRFIGLYTDFAGTIGIKHNNSNYEWSSTSVVEGQWYTGELRYNDGQVDVFIDGQHVMTRTVGPLMDFQGDHNVTITDFSEGNAFYGCIRDLMVIYDADTIMTGNFE